MHTGSQYCMPRGSKRSERWYGEWNQVRTPSAISIELRQLPMWGESDGSISLVGWRDRAWYLFGTSIKYKINTMGWAHLEPNKCIQTKKEKKKKKVIKWRSKKVNERKTKEETIYTNITPRTAQNSISSDISWYTPAATSSTSRRLERMHYDGGSLISWPWVYNEYLVGLCRYRLTLYCRRRHEAIKAVRA